MWCCLLCLSFSPALSFKVRVFAPSLLVSPIEGDPWWRPPSQPDDQAPREPLSLNLSVVDDNVRAACSFLLRRVDARQVPRARQRVPDGGVSESAAGRAMPAHASAASRRRQAAQRPNRRPRRRAPALRAAAARAVLPAATRRRVVCGHVAGDPPTGGLRERLEPRPPASAVRATAAAGLDRAVRGGRRLHRPHPLPV